MAQLTQNKTQHHALPGNRPEYHFAGPRPFAKSRRIFSRARTGISQRVCAAKLFVNHAAIDTYRSAGRFPWPRNCSKRSVEMQSSNQPENSLPENWLSIAARGVIAFFLLFCIVQVARETVASWLAGRNSLEAIARAERWDPSNPDYPAQFARTLAASSSDADPREVAASFAAATRLGPHRADNWAAFGESLELEGNIPGATLAWERALELFPRSPAISWQFANFLIRSGESAKAASPLRTTMLGDPELRTGAFDLAWRAGMPRDEILKIIPARQDILSAYLDYLDATGRLDASAGAWKLLLALPEPVDIDAAFRYFDALLSAHRLDELSAMWSRLAHHEADRIHWRPDATNRITNGGFEEHLSGGGFGWRATAIDGADISFDTATFHDGSQSLFIHFDGKHNLDFGHLGQYVLVSPNTHYRFSAFMRSEGITTDSGPRIAIYDAFDRAALALETENITGTSAWREQALDFRTGPNTRILFVQVVRQPSHKLDNQIAGTVWLDDFSLTALP
jgi:tetratricopeptide (TPR) repeat protein